MYANVKRLAPAALVLAGFLLGAGPADAQGKKPAPGPVPLGGVDDAAGMFSADAVRTAKDKIDEIRRKTGKDLVIQTFDTPPAKYKGQKADEFASKWAEEQFRNNRINGIYVLLCDNKKLDIRILRVQVGDATVSAGSFSRDNSKELYTRIKEKLAASGAEAKEGNDKKAQELRDQALLAAVSYAGSHMTAPVAGRPAARDAAAAPVRQSFWSSTMGIVCIALSVVAVVWLIIGIIRAMSGSGQPGYGGGGGGGFGTALLGGLFGAMAGMWLYNSMFGGSTPTAGADPGATGADGTPNDVGGGSSGEGGDWGGDAGGGADAGGGDWGGGGGDWGGGGGGDW